MNTAFTVWKKFKNYPLPYIHIGIYIFYLLIAILLTWPLVKNLSDTLAGGFLTDAYQISRHSWWINYALRHDEPVFDQPAMGYPDGLSGALIWGNPLQFFPAWLFTFVMSVPAAYNLTLLLRLALDGWAAYWLAYYLTGKQRGPALLAGLVFMTYPALQGRIYGGHSDVLTLWPGALYLYALFRLKESAAKKWFIMAAVCFVLGLAGNTSLLVYYLMPLSGVFLLARLVMREWGWLRRSIVAMCLGSVLSLIFLLPVALETWSTPQYDTEIGGSIRYSADLLGIVSPSFFHPAYDGFEYNRHVLGVNLVEGLAYIGILPAFLALVGFWKIPAARGWFVLALVAWIFSLGPVLKIEDEPVTIRLDQFEGTVYESYVTLPWAALQKLPVLNITRTPGRFNLAVGLAMAMMAGYGAAFLWNRIPRRQWRYVLLVPVMGAIFWDYRAFWPMPNVPAEIPSSVYALADRDDIRAIFSVPWDDRILAKHALYFQTAHEQPIIAGQFIRDTPVNPAKLSILQHTLDAALLKWAGADVVIWHKGGPASETLNTLTRATLDTPYYEDEQIAIFNVPEPPATPAFTTLLAAQTHLEHRADSYFFAPEAGWVEFTGTLNANGREVTFWLDDQQIYRVHVESETVFRIPLLLREAGFYTARLQAEPPCPAVGSAALTCREVEIEQLALENFAPDPTAEDELLEIQFERGLQLVHAQLGEVHPGEILPLYLWWQFDEPLTDLDVRFVHVLDQNNTLITQSDVGLPVNFDEQSIWAEIPAVRLPDTLAPGIYRVVVGWYSHPAITPIRILTENPQVNGATLLIGTFEIKARIVG